MIMALGVRSIRHKLMIGMLMTTVMALFISGFSFIANDLDNYQTRVSTELITQAKLIGQGSVAALQFQDSEAANDTLSLLRLRPEIDAAVIYDAQGKPFARYFNSDRHADELPDSPSPDSLLIERDKIRLFQRVRSNGEIQGTVFIAAESGLEERAAQVVMIAFGVTVLALVASTVLSFWIQSRITRPVLEVTELARQVIERHDYGLRAEKTTSDEIGYLVDAFNNMLSQIGQRTAELEASNGQLAREVGVRADAEAALRESERRYRTLVTTLTTVIWRADGEGGFQPSQSAWDGYTGQTPETNAGEGWLNAFHPDDREGLRLLWRQACEEGAPMERSLRLWHERGQEYRYVLFKAVPLLGLDGRPQEWMGVVDDVHERMQATQEVVRLNAELEQRVAIRTADLESANKELEAFSYSVSHDLRAPLRTIDGFSLALQEDYREGLDATAQDYLDRVRAAAQRMGRLIDDMLNLSRVSRMELERQPLDLSAIAQELVAELRERDPQREVTVEIAGGLLAYGDARLIRVALENLLNNAWKYTGKTASPYIEFGKGESGFFVRDNGAGFDMAYANRLFAAFQRLHDAREFPGTGVGLATVQRVIRRHGGRIWAESRVNEGATFFFTLSSNEENHHEQ